MVEREKNCEIMINPRMLCFLLYYTLLLILNNAMLEFPDSCFNIDISFIKCTREHRGAKSKIILINYSSISYIST